MKKFILSLTVLMSIVGTSSSFGSTKSNHFQSPKTEQVVNHNDNKSDKQCNCKTCKELVKKQQTKKCNCKFRTCSPEHQNKGKCVKNYQKGQLVGVGRGWQQKKSDPITEQSSPTRSPSCKILPNVRQTINRK